MRSAHEFYVANDQEGHLKTAQERDRSKEGFLQMGWFEYRCKNLQASEIDALAERIAENQPSEIRREYILQGSPEIKKEAILADLVDPEGSQSGSVERQWFRAEASREPLDERFQMALDQFGNSQEEKAYELLDTYFAESVVTH